MSGPLDFFAKLRSAAPIASTLLGLFMLMFAAALLYSPTQALAQTSGGEIAAEEPASVHQSLEDIMRRQGSAAENEKFLRAPPAEKTDATDKAIFDQLGIRGVESDSDIYRQLRDGTAKVTVSTGKPADAVLMQKGGMQWIAWREGPLIKYGLYTLGGMLAVLVLFFILRGRIKVDSGLSGVLMQRFSSIERFGHWLLAGSFILLAITGLWTILGRTYIIQFVGKETYANMAFAGKWVHNNVAWAFILGLIIVFLQWVLQNLPSRHDIVWILKGGGIFKKGVHPPSKKFNAGQKVIFWSVILLGIAISMTGISLLFPFESPLIGKLLGVINDTAPEFAASMGLPAHLLPHQEMQYAQLIHGGVAFIFIAIILAHIYIGSIGMQGAFSAMGSGKVDRNWAKEHHSLWVAKVDAKKAAKEAANPKAST
ncbi:MAG: formate dehydrogenase subunit gamma [Hyphomicrobiales bacterium]|nr:MAG: formate dehydrogenase subunit gamma [Hyphomicrobiales bacterium]